MIRVANACRVKIKNQDKKLIFNLSEADLQIINFYSDLKKEYIFSVYALT